MSVLNNTPYLSWSLRDHKIAVWKWLLGEAHSKAVEAEADINEIDITVNPGMYIVAVAEHRAIIEAAKEIEETLARLGV